jgi:hypothetical protein
MAGDGVSGTLEGNTLAGGRGIEAVASGVAVKYRGLRVGIPVGSIVMEIVETGKRGRALCPALVDARVPGIEPGSASLVFT